MLLIPAIDLKDGKCVRLRQGRMEDETIFSDNPLAIAEQWVKAGARRAVPSGQRPLQAAQGLHQFHPWQHQQIPMAFGVGGRNAHPMALVGQGAGQVPADEAGAAENADLAWVHVLAGW